MDEIEEMAEILMNKKTTNQEVTAMPPINGFTISKAANEVATPLPPLNLMYMGKIWAKTPTMAVRQIKLIFSGKKLLAKRTAMAALAPSRIKVQMPNFLPKTRAALVAPIFLEPFLRKSALPKIFAKTKPKGMAQIR